MTDQMEQLL